MSRQRSARPLPPGVERRRRLRQERRREQLIQVWRLLLFSGSATALGWLLLSLGWTLRSPEQLRVNGSERIDSEAVTKVAGLSFPLPLLSLDPRALERTLLQELPVQSAAVHRRLLPPALDVVLEDRRPIAAASRVSPGGMERGMIDRNGQWMPQTVASRGDRPETSILVMGWTARHRPILAQLLERRDALGSPLQRISIAPDGAISIQTAALGRVDLGADPNLLDQQVVSIAQLSRSLPSHLRQKAGTSIDLSDPAKPELQLHAGKTPASES